jgi:hypothetical protein
MARSSSRPVASRARPADRPRRGQNRCAQFVVEEEHFPDGWNRTARFSSGPRLQANAESPAAVGDVYPGLNRHCRSDIALAVHHDGHVVISRLNSQKPLFEAVGGNRSVDLSSEVARDVDPDARSRGRFLNCGQVHVGLGSIASHERDFEAEDAASDARHRCVWSALPCWKRTPSRSSSCATSAALAGSPGPAGVHPALISPSALSTRYTWASRCPLLPIQETTPCAALLARPAATAMSPYEVHRPSGTDSRKAAAAVRSSLVGWDATSGNLPMSRDRDDTSDGALSSTSITLPTTASAVCAALQRTGCCGLATGAEGTREPILRAGRPTGLLARVPRGGGEGPPLIERIRVGGATGVGLAVDPHDPRPPHACLLGRGAVLAGRRWPLGGRRR